MGWAGGITEGKQSTWEKCLQESVLELSEVEGALKGFLVQLPCSGQGCLQLSHSAQGPVQSDLGTGAAIGWYQCGVTVAPGLAQQPACG